jgi:hypothetical protein
MELFYAFFKADAFKTARKPYTTLPDKWNEEIRPTFSEPGRNDELAEWARHAYGIESMHCMLPPWHPARDALIPIYSAMDAKYEVPVIKGAYVAAIEEFIEDYFYPYYQEGHGCVLCPVCIVDDEDDPCLLDREQFVRHFQRRHHQNIGMLGLAFSPNYNTRMMEALILYILCHHHASDYSSSPENYPFVLPNNQDKFGHSSIVNMDESLVSFFEDLHRKKKTGKSLRVWNP